MAEDIPSFKKKWMVDPMGHNDFMAPAGEKSKKLLEHINTALGEVAMSNSAHLTSMILAFGATLTAVLN